MQTRCPHCQTLFEIQQEQLDAASGQARCSYCDSIFNARKNLLVHDVATQPKAHPAAQPGDQSGFSLNTLFDEGDLDDAGRAELEKRLAGAAATPPKTPARRAASDSEHASTLTSSAAPGDLDLGEDLYLPTGPGAETPEPEQGPEDEMPVYLRPSSEAGRRRSRHPLLWSLAILAMLGLALAQLAWFSRGALQPYPEIRALLELACGRLECELPPWHEPDKFHISERTVATHPQSDQALLIRLRFSNRARFAQAYPLLQLSLFDLDESLAARRRFTPDEYLREPADAPGMLHPGESAEVEMALRDPGREITAFIIEFL